MVGMGVAGLRIIPDGSVLLTSRATIGVVAVNAMPVTTNQGFQSLIPRSGTDSLWLYYWVSSMRHELEKRGAGSTFREVSRDSVRGLPLCLPPAQEQQVIAGMLDGVDKVIERAEDERDGLQALKTSTSDALLTGRVRVGKK